MNPLIHSKNPTIPPLLIALALALAWLALMPMAQAANLSPTCQKIDDVIEGLEQKKQYLADQLKQEGPGLKPIIKEQIDELNETIQAKKIELKKCIEEHPYVPPDALPKECAALKKEIEKLRTALSKEVHRAVAHQQEQLHGAPDKAQIIEQIKVKTADIEKNSPTAKKLADTIEAYNRCIAIKVSEMGHYCSITSAGAPGAWDAAWDSAGGDPCATLITKHGSAVTIQRKGLFHKTNMNNAIVRCSEGVWVFTALGTQALKNAYDAGSGRSNCVITAAPREIPIFTKPVSDADITAYGWTAKQPCFPGSKTSCFGGYDHARPEIEPLELPAPGGTVKADIVNYKGEPKPGFIDNHYGHDAGLPKGIPIRAVAAGTVVRAWCWDTKSQPTGSDSRYQKEVILEHVIQGSSSKYEERFYTLYAHLDSIKVAQGQYVDQGQEIGTAGCNGTCSGTHLHFQVHKRSNTANELLRPFVEDTTSVVSCESPQPKTDVVVPHNLNPTLIDPWGWYGPVFDPWAFRAYDKGKGALSINLWKPGQAPAMDDAWD